MRKGVVVNLLYFLQNCPILRSLHLDLHDGWWEKCGSRFERGVVEWIESRPRITHFYVKQLSQDRHLQIQELLRERRGAAFEAKVVLENRQFLTVFRWVLRIQQLMSEHLPGDWSKAMHKRFLYRDSNWF